MRYSSLAFLFFISSWLYSQESNIKFSNLSINDGLCQSYVYSILQDSEGFMWFGTNEGLNKYDGNEFVHYKFELADSNSLSGNFVTSLFETSDNNIWIATQDGGINIFNKQSEKFEHINSSGYNRLKNNSINTIFEDSKNNIWIGTTRGLGKFETHSNTFIYEINILPVKHSLDTVSITAFHEDRTNNIWVGTSTGELYTIVNQTDEIIKILPLNNFEVLDPDKICSILRDKANEYLLWIISERGLFKYDILIERLEKINLGIQENIKFNKGIIDYNNIIWIGSKNSGLFKYNSSNNSIQKFEHKLSDRNSISNNNILSFCIGFSDLLWIGTKGGGVNKLYYDNFYHIYHDTYNKSDLISNNIWTVNEDSLGFLWIGTDNGLEKINKSNNKIIHYQNDPNNSKSISKGTVFTYCEDQYKNTWVGTAEGLNLLNKETNEFEHFINEANNPKSLNNNNIKVIYNDSFGNLWIGTRGGGLNKFNYKDKSFTHFTHNVEDTTSISGNIINTIFETSDGILWIGTSGNGLEKLNRKDNTFTHYNFDKENSNSINDIYILSLIEDSDNNLWIGTFNGGLNRFNYHKGEFTHFTTANGLASNIIYSIEIDDNNNLWLSSNGALSKFSITDHSIINYNTENGLENIEFNQNSSCKNKDGQLFFGGINGINYFDPEVFNPEIKLTSFYFTKLLLNNKITHDGKNIPINKSIIFESQVKLKYNEYPFSIYFSLLDYQYLNNNNYKYKIKELSEHWIDIGNENKITFTKLSPGKYTLEVKASNPYNELNETKSIDIIIIPPFWKKIWFFSIELLLLLIIIFSYIFFREKRIRKDKKILEFKVKFRTKELENQKEELKTSIEFNQKQQEHIKKQNIELELHKNNLESLVEERTVDLKKAKNKAEESDRLKSSFLANISHEIRTPMNAIVGFSDLLRKKGNPTSKEIKMLNLIHFNSNSLLNLINDIIDLAKLEQGEIFIHKESSDINKILEDIFETFSKNPDLIQKEIELELIQFNELVMLNTDPERVKQMLSKLLDNAIKYTEKGRIEFGYKIDNKNTSIQFYVKDTGIGLSDTQKNEIFKLFRKIETDKNKLYRGIGLGLTFCHKLVQMLSGEIWVESKINIGSTFYFSLPLKNPSPIKLEDKNFITSDWKDKNILIAEDEINNYKFLLAILKPTQANIIHAKNGEEAVNLVNTLNNIDLILMDIKMPVMDGLKATKIIRKTHKKIKIIAFTAYAMPNDESIAINYGCDDYISKPAKAKQIMKIINKHLN
ncbi:MAG: response regulator [Bacteroidales bacterium]|nr:response regulator [Bacteroidales bacterium]